MAQFQKHIRNTFLTGIFAAIPLAATAFIIYYIEKTTRELAGVKTPFAALLLAIVTIYVLGLLVSSVIGKFLIGWLDRILSRMPVLKDLYQAWKHVSITPGGREGIFAKVVLIPVETGRNRVMGFSSGEAIDGNPDVTCVFVPGLPNPITGRLYFVPLADCIFTDITPEAAFKILLSTGNWIPSEIGKALADKSLTAPTPVRDKTQMPHRDSHPTLLDVDPKSLP
jgi:uncharacterized membrane protein